MIDILNMIYIFPAMIIAFTFHEFAHAFVADKLGDKTPRFQGRLTLNPMKHIDPLGFLAVLIFKFGWAKPVETNPRAYKNFYKDDLKVSLAGPLMNFVVAFVFTIVFAIYMSIMPGIFAGAAYKFIYTILIYIIMINVNIGVFNLLPIPGLDGFHILRDLFPNKFYKYESEIQRYQGIIMILIIIAGGKIIYYPSNFIFNILISFAKMLMKII